MSTLNIMQTIVVTPDVEECPQLSQWYIPWPSIIVSILGIIIIIYLSVGPSIETSRRVFGVLLMVLWTAIWALLLWVLWRECRHQTAWWMLLIPIIAMILLLMLVVVIS